MEDRKPERQPEGIGLPVGDMTPPPEERVIGEEERPGRRAEQMDVAPPGDEEAAHPLEEE